MTDATRAIKSVTAAGSLPSYSKFIGVYGSLLTLLCLLYSFRRSHVNFEASYTARGSRDGCDDDK